MTTFEEKVPEFMHGGKPPAPRPGLLRSPGFKFFAIAVLCGVLLVPLMMVWALTGERESRRQEVLGSIGRDWGQPQTIAGPILMVPFTVERQYTQASDGQRRTTVERRTLVILPDDIAVTADAPVERRRVSIFEAPVYTAELKATGRFGRIDPRLFGADLRGIEWDRAVLVVGLPDPGGIENAALSSGTTTLTLEPGDGIAAAAAPTSIHAKLPAAITAGGDASTVAAGFSFALDLRLRGTGSLAVAPVGKQSDIELTSTWPHPSFQLGSLPSEREIAADGFSARWRIPFLARAVPQSWVLEDAGLDRFAGEAVGASFVDPVDGYALTERALKYGLMFVASVFGIVFVLEILSPRRIHVVQYALVGLILVFFYVLLLALGEHVGFDLAYGVAAGATGLVVSAFVGLALESKLRALAAAGAFAGLFALLYAILRSEDFALLAGAITGFTVLTVVLFATRRVDWSGARGVEGAT